MSQTDGLAPLTDAVVRHSNGHSRPIITIGKLTVDLDARSVAVERTRVRLTPKEYQVLELLAIGEGSTVTKEMFMSHLYDGMDEPKPKIIDVFICLLRKKLAAATGGAKYIGSVRGGGYTLRDRLVA